MAILKIKEKTFISTGAQEYQEIAPFVPAYFSSQTKLSEAEVAAIGLALHLMLPKDFNRPAASSASAWKINALQGALR